MFANVSLKETIEYVLVETKNACQIRKQKKEPMSLDLLLMDHKMYFEREIDLSGFKVADLKKIAKNSKISQCGVKNDIIHRINHHFICVKSAIAIQRTIRGMFVRNALSNVFRGKAFKNRSICVNQTDFCTMEPIEEISFQQFCSFTDIHDITYGYDIHSLIMLSRKQTPFKGITKMRNPYNRIPFGEDVTKKINILYKLIRLVFPNNMLPNDDEYIPWSRPRPRRQRRDIHRRGNMMYSTEVESSDPIANAIPFSTQQMTRYMSTSISYLTAGSEPSSISSVSVQMLSRIQLLASIRERPTSTRIREVFMEIDQLGNYTDSAWMTSLSVVQLQRLYRNLIDIWRYRANIPHDVRHRICPIEDPFLMVSTIINDNELDEARRMCLHTMELMIFSAFDVEFRKIGAMHVLTALTGVSMSARASFSWLYESMY